MTAQKVEQIIEQKCFQEKSFLDAELFFSLLH